MQLKSFVLDLNVEVDVVLCWSWGFDNLGGIPKVKKNLTGLLQYLSEGSKLIRVQ